MDWEDDPESSAVPVSAVPESAVLLELENMMSWILVTLYEKLYD